MEWSGFGFVTGLIGFGSLILTEYIAEDLTANEFYYQENSWLIFLGMVIAAVLSLAFYKLLKLFSKPKIVIDKETGDEIELNSNHSLFFINIKWWPIVYIVIGLILMVTNMKEVSKDNNNSSVIEKK